MFELKVKTNARLPAKELRTVTEKATRRAGDLASRQLQRESGDYILEKKALSARFVRSQLELRRPRDQLKWWLRVQGAPVPLERYPFRVVTRGRRRGIVAQINRGRWAPLSRRAFFAGRIVGGTGNLGVEARLFKRRGKSRYPIQRLFGSRLTDVLQNESYRTVHMRANFRMALEFERIVLLEIAKVFRPKARVRR